jgi:hypothetical protein
MYGSVTSRFQLGFSYGKLTQNASTAIVVGIPPFPGPPGTSPRIFGTDAQKLSTTAASRVPGPVNTFGGGQALVGRSCVTRIRALKYTTAATSHTVAILRPLNWTTVAAAANSVATTLTLTSNPGLYSTNYNYPVGGGVTTPFNTVDVTPANTHYYMVQLADGTWFTDIISAFNATSLVLTLTATMPAGTATGGGVAANAILYFMGSASTVDPATGQLHPSRASAVNTNDEDLVRDDTGIGGVAGLRPGDPLVVVSNNASNAGTIVGVEGYYADR